VAGAPAGSVTADSQGLWTFDLVPDAANGTVVSAQAGDTAGNLSTVATTTVDAAAGIQIDATLMGDNIFNNSEAGAVQLSGTTTSVEAGQVVQLKLTDSAGTVFNGTATVGADGRWSTSTLNLTGAAHGVIAIAANVFDQLGNAASATAPTQLAYVVPVDILAIDRDLGISTTDLLTADTEIAVTGVADPDGTVTLTGAVRYLGDTGTVDANGDPVVAVMTYNLNQAVTVAADGTWRAELVSSAPRWAWTSRASRYPWWIPARSRGYGLTATWSRTGVASFTDTAPVNVNSVAPDLLTQAVGPTSERLVNSFVNFNQLASRAVGLEDGGYVIVWASNGQDVPSTTGIGIGLFGQRYDASGNRLGGEFRVNTTVAGNQGLTSRGDFAEMFDLDSDKATGGFVVVWSSQQKGGSYDIDTRGTPGTGGAYNVFGQRFDANGVPVTTDIDGNGAIAATNEFIVNSAWDSTTSQALGPRITSLENGNFVMVWASNATRLGYDVRAQMFSTSWQRIGGEISVTQQKYNQGYRVDAGTDWDNLTVTSRSGGGFAVTWGGSDPSLASASTDNANIYSAVYNSTGVAVGTRKQVNTGVTGTQFAPVSTTLANGSSVVVWVSTQDGIYDVFSQRYDAAGVRSGAETRVNVMVASRQGTVADVSNQVSVRALDSGGYVVVWAGRGTAGATDDNIYMRVYSAAGVPLGAQDVLVNQSLKGIQQLPHVAALEGGGFIVTWSSQYASTDRGTDYGVMQRAYNDDGTARPQALDAPEVLLNSASTTNSQYGSSISASPHRRRRRSWLPAGSSATLLTVMALPSRAPVPPSMKPPRRPCSTLAATSWSGAISSQESGITVESPALASNGTTGNDVLTGANGNDGLVTHGGQDTVHGGNGNDHIYESNTALPGQYFGDSGLDTLVLDFSGPQNINLAALVGHAHGIERIDLGNNSFKVNSTNLRIDDLSNVTAITDAGVGRLLVRGARARVSRWLLR
jgi:hypothetical protein